jgi:transcriptional regulator with XRE-family HTH domain
MTMADFGAEVRRFMTERRMSLRGLARAAGYDASHLSKVLNGHKPASPYMAARLDDSLGAQGKIKDALASVPRPAETRRSRDLTAWVRESNTSDDAILQIAQAAGYLEEAHGRVPAKSVLAEVLKLHRQAQAVLRTGKQRLRQTRELMRIDSGLLAHACLLLGDLGQNRVANEYGAAALLFAQEAEADEAISWSVQAKTARWQERYVESAELARRGFEASALTPTRVELAYREANAIALFGDSSRALRALQLADKAAETLPADDSAVSVWSFPAERRAVFALSVAIHTRDSDSALRAVAMADAGWAAGSRKVPATWAQIRAGAAIAYLMKGSLDGAAEQVTSVLSLSPELRIGTVTGYLKNLDRRLDKPILANSKTAIELRRQIREFNSSIPSDEQAMEDA